MTEDRTASTQSVVFPLWQDRMNEVRLQLRSNGTDMSVEAVAMDTIVRTVKDDFGDYMDASTHNAQQALAMVLERLAQDLATGRLVLKEADHGR